MHYLLSVKTRSDDTFEATVVGIPSCTGAGHSREEAIHQVKACLEQQLSQGELVTIEVDTPRSAVSSWLKLAGTFKDDPTFDDFIVEVNAYRQSVDTSDLAE